MPDAAAEGNPYTTLGIRKGGDANEDPYYYLQGATFYNDKFTERIDMHNHNRPDHPFGHKHKAKSPNAAEKKWLPL